MLRKLLPILLTLCLTGCSVPNTQEKTQYQATFLTLFDTVTTIVGRDENEAALQQKAQEIHDQPLEYHQLFDIYHEYEGINNLKTINDQAGVAPVTVDRRIMSLISDCKQFCQDTQGMVDITMGSVLSLWNRARTDSLDDPSNAHLPDASELTEAARHTGFDRVVIDEVNSTIYLTDPEVRLDVGAVAKGWSVEQVAKNAPSGLLLSVGGNVRATGPKDDAGTPWVVGITDPDDQAKYLHTIYNTDSSVVTSGDYQRYFVVDGVPYHHIIDPETLFPAKRWRSVTIVCPDSGIADALSTALFLLPQEDGQAILDRFHAHAMWVDQHGNRYYSPEFQDLIRT